MTHDFEGVILFLRQLRARGAFGSTELVWKGQDVVHVRHTDSYKPGELPAKPLT